MGAGIAAAVGILLLALTPRVMLRVQRRRRVFEHKRRFHREYLVPLREFARESDRAQ